MGTGDWNDGMNLVGAEGKGESVWLGWFLCRILRPFADARRRARRRATAPTRYRAHADGARPRRSTSAWDGDWYRRAYFDDGTPLGSKENTECRIDAIAQSWAVHLRRRRSGARAAGDGVGRRSSSCATTIGIVLLLTPPFDTMTPSPGYIQGYVPGVRENGGQYTHAALWTVLAFARLGDGDRATELFAMLNPVNHARTRRGRRALPRRALRRRGRRLLAAAAHRPRRLDLVHGIGRLDVSRRARGDPRLHAPRRRAAHRPVHPERRGRATRWSSRPAAPNTASSSRTRAA